MTVSATTLTTPIVLSSFSTNVEIFGSTKARDIPGKIDALAVGLKSNVNTNTTTLTTFINTTVVGHINTELGKIVTDHNTTMNAVITGRTTYETNLNSSNNTFQTNLISANNTYKTSITTQQNNYQNEVTNNLANYLDSYGAGYTMSQVRDFIYSGPMGSITYDTNGNVNGYTAKNISAVITYDANGNVSGITETILIDGVPTIRMFTPAYDASGNLTAITDVTPVPPAPTTVSGVAGVGSATITFNNSSTGANSYNIYYAKETGVTALNYTTKTGGTKLTNVTSPRAITDLAVGTVYYFVVTGVNHTGEGVSSSQVQVTTL